MKKTIKSIFIATFIFLLLSVPSAFAAKTPEDLGKEHGEEFGKIIGEIYGKKHFEDGRKMIWWDEGRDVFDEIPELKEYIDAYHKSGSTQGKYNSAFDDAFYENFTEKYIESYQNANKEKNVEFELSDSEAEKLGKLYGEKRGSSDGKSQVGSFKQSGEYDYVVPSKGEVILDTETDNGVELSSASESYQDTFYKAYIEGYQYGFKRELFPEIRTESNIGMFGGKINSQDNIVSLTIEKGTFYYESFMSIDRKGPPFEVFTPGSYEYAVEVENSFNSVELRKPLKLEFQYIGSDNVGIYQKDEDGSWEYMKTYIEEDKIYTYIEGNKYEGSSFMFLIDDNEEPFTDIDRHWAEGEIRFFKKNKLISGYEDNTFRPDVFMRRGDFLTVLDRVVDFKGSANYNNLNQFVDVDLMGYNKESISKAINLGYVSGYGDGTFRPNMPISYKEAESIIKRVVSSDFAWKDFSKTLISEKQILSKGYFNTDELMNRAEAVYMMYKIKSGTLGD